MTEIKVGESESIDSAIRRLQKVCKENVAELKRRQYYQKPSEIRRRRRSRKKS